MSRREASVDSVTIVSSVENPTETLLGALEYFEIIEVIGDSTLMKNPFWKIMPSPIVNAYPVPIGLVFTALIWAGATLTVREVDSVVVFEGFVFE